MAGVPEVHARYHAATGAMTYVVHDPLTRDAAIVDPVLDLDPATGRARTGELEPVLDLVRDLRLRVRWILETHVHADHVSAAWRLRDLLGGSVGTGQHVVAIRDRLAPLHPHLRTGAGAHGFDRLFADGEELSLGAIAGRVFHTPGHTPSCVTYLFGDAAFIGDTLFMPDVGSARCDFPGGDARALYRSVGRLWDLPPETRLFICHDYPPPSRPHPAWETNVAEQKRFNIHLNETVSEEAFVAFRRERDSKLSLPKLFRPSIEMNLGGGVAAEDRAGL